MRHMPACEQGRIQTLLKGMNLCNDMLAYNTKSRHKAQANNVVC